MSKELEKIKKNNVLKLLSKKKVFVKHPRQELVESSNFEKEEEKNNFDIDTESNEFNKMNVDFIQEKINKLYHYRAMLVSVIVVFLAVFFHKLFMLEDMAYFELFFIAGSVVSILTINHNIRNKVKEFKKIEKSTDF